MEFIQTFVPTSKAQLLQVAMWYHQGDMVKAQQMVDFYTKNLSLPDTDPVPPSWIDQAKSLFGWLKENQGDLMQGYQVIQGLIKNKGALTLTEDAVEALPPINE